MVLQQGCSASLAGQRRGPWPGSREGVPGRAPALPPPLLRILPRIPHRAAPRHPEQRHSQR